MKNCCCSCTHNKRQTGENRIIRCYCDIDGHNIGYVACFESVCEKYEKEPKKQGGEQMSNRVKNESRSFHGSTVYLTNSEKEALIRAIDQYTSAVTYATDREFIDFFQKYDEQALISAENKLTKRG